MINNEAMSLIEELLSDSDIISYLKNDFLSKSLIEDDCYAIINSHVANPFYLYHLEAISIFEALGKNEYLIKLFFNEAKKKLLSQSLHDKSKVRVSNQIRRTNNIEDQFNVGDNTSLVSEIQYFVECSLDITDFRYLFSVLEKNWSSLFRVIHISNSYLSTDPNISMIKSRLATEIITNKLLFCYGLEASEKKLAEKILMLKRQGLDKEIAALLDYSRYLGNRAVHHNNNSSSDALKSFRGICKVSLWYTENFIINKPNIKGKNADLTKRNEVKSNRKSDVVAISQNSIEEIPDVILIREDRIKRKRTLEEIKKDQAKWFRSMLKK